MGRAGASCAHKRNQQSVKVVVGLIRATTITILAAPPPLHLPPASFLRQKSFPLLLYICCPFKNLPLCFS